ncbi:MAG: class I SAM-dependent methyltransferase, partial [Verrucomicrobiota bacterium]
RSPRPDPETFPSWLPNKADLKRDGLKLEVLIKNSRDLTEEDTGKNVRFFHIDGGHNCDEALDDLRTAARSLVDGGCIALDDPFRIEWPGVTEALVRFLDEAPEYQLVAVGFNKAMVVKADVAGDFAAKVRDVETRKRYGLGYPWSLKQLPFVDRDVDILFLPQFRLRKSMGHRLAQAEKSLATFFGRTFRKGE